MIRSRRYNTARRIESVLVLSLSQLIVFLFLPVTGRSQSNQNEPEDQFIAQHSRDLRQNPEGVSFKLRILGDKTQFRQGEIISVEYSFASSLRKTYELYDQTHDRSGRVHLDNFIL